MALTAPSIEFSMGTKARSARPLLHGFEGVAQRRGRRQVGRGVVGLGEQCLFGEGPGRAQEADGARARRAGGPAASMCGRIVGTMDEPALRQLLDDVRAGPARPRRRRGPTAPAPVRRPGVRACRSPPCAAAAESARRCTRRGRRPAQCAEIVTELLAEPGGTPVLLTRADAAQVAATLEVAPGGEVTMSGALATVCWRPAPASAPGGVVVVTAGTADLPVAEECLAVLRAFGLLPDARGRLRGGGRAPSAGVGRRGGRSRRRRRSRGDGGCTGQPGRPGSPVRPSSPCRCRPGTAPRSTASPRCSPCTRRVRRGSPWSGIDNGFGAACAVARMLP